tara:strand:+ start:67 stop:345 length:279 start_codon:yes stop_codon:yes gene_type:complete
MNKFMVTFQVAGDDEMNRGIIYTTKKEFESENLESLFDLLEEGIGDETIQPEIDVPHIDGDINVEYVLIHDNNKKEVYRDEDFDETKVSKFE